LDVRPDVRAVRNIASCCYALQRNSVLDEETSLCFVLAANRIWDPSTCAALKTHIQRCPRFNLPSMRLFLKETRERVQSEGARLGNPTGCAGAHSGLTWLRDLCESQESMANFKIYVRGLVPKLRNKHGGPSDTVTLWCAISKISKHGDRRRLPRHLGLYYKMQTFRVCRHAFCVHCPRAHARRACKDSKFLWHEVLTKYSQGGAKKKTPKLGLRSWEKAKRFCTAMRKVKSNYCMCDLACWICLS
jgi:hypothetical protein